MSRRERIAALEARVLVLEAQMAARPITSLSTYTWTATENNTCSCPPNYNCNSVVCPRALRVTCS